jgi:hypothetical protein
MIIIGNIGSDAGYWVLDGTGLHHVGGWGADQLVEFKAAINIISLATQLKTPGLADAAIKSVQAIVQKQIAEHVRDSGAGPVVVILG